MSRAFRFFPSFRAYAHNHGPAVKNVKGVSNMKCPFQQDQEAQNNTNNTNNPNKRDDKDSLTQQLKQRHQRHFNRHYHTENKRVGSPSHYNTFLPASHSALYSAYQHHQHAEQNGEQEQNGVQNEPDQNGQSEQQLPFIYQVEPHFVPQYVYPGPPPLPPPPQAFVLEQQHQQDLVSNTPLTPTPTSTPAPYTRLINPTATVRQLRNLLQSRRSTEAWKHFTQLSDSQQSLMTLQDYNSLLRVLRTQNVFPNRLERVKIMRYVLFDEMRDKFHIHPNTVSYISLMAGYAKIGDVVAVENLIAEMDRSGIQKGSMWKNILLECYTRKGDLTKAEEFFEQNIRQAYFNYEDEVEESMDSDLKSKTILLSGYNTLLQALNSSSTNPSETLEYPVKDLFQNISSWTMNDNTMSETNHNRFFALYQQLIMDDLVPDATTYDVLIDVASKTRNVQLTEKLIQEKHASQHGYPFTTYEKNSILRLYFVLKDYDSVRRVFYDMLNQGVKPNFTSFEYLLGSYLADLSQPNGAFKCWHVLQKETKKFNVSLNAGLLRLVALSFGPWRVEATGIQFDMVSNLATQMNTPRVHRSRNNTNQRNHHNDMSRVLVHLLESYAHANDITSFNNLQHATIDYLLNSYSYGTMTLEMVRGTMNTIFKLHFTFANFVADTDTMALWYYLPMEMRNEYGLLQVYKKIGRSEGYGVAEGIVREFFGSDVDTAKKWLEGAARV